MSKKMKDVLRKINVALLIFILVLPFVPAMNAKGSIDGNGNISVNKFESRPTIDGKISVEEWGEKIFTVKEGEPNIHTILQDGTAPAPFTADIYLGYDNSNFYIGVVAEYEVHKNEALLPTDVWQGDCMQIQIGPSIGGDRNEMGFTLNSLTNKNQAVSWTHGPLFSMEGGEGNDYIVSRDGTTTVYEIAIPASHVPNLDSFADGSQIPFSLCFHMNAGGFLEFMDGICERKDINLAATVTLGEAKPLEATTMDDNGNLAIKKLDAAPALDGSISEAEWGTKAFVVADGAPNIFTHIQDGVAPAPFNADIYLGYDNSKFYIGVVAEYETHKNEALLPTDIWQGDCMQIQIASEPGGDRDEMGFTLNSLTNKNQAVSWTHAPLFTMEGEGTDYIVKRDGNKTIYEIAIPANQIPNLDSFADGKTIPFSLSFHMNEGGFLEFKDGIVSQKNINLAAFAGLGVQPSVKAPSNGGEEQTSDGPSVSGNLIDSQSTRGNRTAPGILEAEEYNEMYGIESRTEDCGDEGGTLNLGFLNNGDYLVYNDVDFTKAPKKFYVRAAGGNVANPTIRLIFDSLENPVAAEVGMEMTGKGWQSYDTFSADISESITGKHTVYVLLDGNMNLNWVGFDIDEAEAAAPEPTKAPAPTPTTAPTPTNTPAPTESVQTSTDSDDDGSSNTWIIIVIVVVALVVIGGVCFVVVKKRKGVK